FWWWRVALDTYQIGRLLSTAPHLESGAIRTKATLSRRSLGRVEEGPDELDGDDVLAGHDAAPGEVRAVAVAWAHRVPAAARAAHLETALSQGLDRAGPRQARR